MNAQAVTWAANRVADEHQAVAIASAELEASGIELLGDIASNEDTGWSWRHFRGPDGRVYGLNATAPQ